MEMITASVNGVHPPVAATRIVLEVQLRLFAKETVSRLEILAYLARIKVMDIAIMAF